MRIGELRGKELIDRAGAEHLGVITHVEAMLEGATGRLVNLHLQVRRGWLGATQAVPWAAVEKVGRELVIVNLPAAGPAAAAIVQAAPPPPPPALARPWPPALAARRRRHASR